MQRKVNQIRPHEIAMARDQGEEILIVDVREPFEYHGELGHVPGSLNIPMQQIPENLHIFRNAKGNVALICHTGERSHYTCLFLLDQGITNVMNVDGGMVKWHLSGLDVEYSPEFG
ncbi:MAG: rhodanese-like domain-containing protein [Candidatus Thermoplasmatota archaeon]|nr:rhodanese-like domain-containing protein [Candidatus Thermoplasmatota archaeon]MCL5731631.1 rhodanese-like domain-containing protein [Candidatus Thermoplasmatota archaeon]